jgi:hypothetical protein
LRQSGEVVMATKEEIAAKEDRAAALEDAALGWVQGFLAGEAAIEVTPPSALNSAWRIRLVKDGPSD